MLRDQTDWYTEFRAITSFIERAIRPPVNHTTRPRRPLELIAEAILRSVSVRAFADTASYNISLLSINYDSAEKCFTVLRGLSRARDAGIGIVVSLAHSHPPVSVPLAQCVVTIMPVYGIINYKSVTTITSRNVPGALASALLGHEKLVSEVCETSSHLDLVAFEVRRVLLVDRGKGEGEERRAG